ncbi:hypothetical protein J5U21_00106 [Saccharolobus shibatae]|uniref:Uncharacterized protein n=1 Tax=Saccharolobus shibatae TaxID=2286 RepID=A0A8F5GV28_9CREN|nr:hypothetical protein J5U21_p0106 [Saccharolobus shibatae]QXJ30466.1 hypothetical protein J5U21_00106 [Saccharolobus shibatae]
MNKKTILISFIILSVVITIAVILTHSFVVRVCLDLGMFDSIQIHIVIYIYQCITYVCCIISLLTCIYCTLSANIEKFYKIKEEGIFIK